MPQFQFTVLETVVLEKVYTVDADTEEQARAMAEAGNTDAETTVQTMGVVEREVGGLLTDD